MHLKLTYIFIYVYMNLGYTYAHLTKNPYPKFAADG
jgi:hypothetical protein